MLYKTGMKIQPIIIVLILCCLSTANAYGQENIRKDSIRLEYDSLKTISGKGFILPENTNKSPDFKNTDIENVSTQTPVEKVEIKLNKPFYIPPYYTNPTPMFYGDYSTGGYINPHFYGSGLQTTLPGIGRINQASLMYQYQPNDFFDIQIGIDATKYYLPHSIGQAFRASGTVIYHPNDRFRIKIFGSYTPTFQYGFYRNEYGVTAGYDFTDRFGMEVGIQRYYNPSQGWQIAPIAIPYYKFKKFSIGIDMGGLLYETIKNNAINKP